MNRPALLVLVRHGQSERNIAKKQNRFYLNDEARKPVKGIPDHRITLTDEGRRQASVTGPLFDKHSGCSTMSFTPGTHERRRPRRQSWRPTPPRSNDRCAFAITSSFVNATADTRTT